ncbi:MAG TPA: DUF4118 domain-containing protein, partial [Candidatus Limnocylindria bacterium]|nr:DUF4118 domain-containing protein [Candidatus Limnocylindria bacterium]
MFTYVYAVAAVAVMTALIAASETWFSINNISMLYLPAVLVAAVRYGRGPAIAASIAAFLAFDFFFIDPRLTLTVSDPSEWLSLGVLLLTAIVTGQLAADERARADEALTREREAVVLYDVVRIMGEVDLERALRGVAERIRGELGLTAVVIELRDDATPRRVAAGDEA